MKIDRQSPIPVYQQLKMELLAAIAGQQLKPGDPLPTLLELCERSGVSLRTAQQAVNALCAEGHARRIGRCLVVADGVPAASKLPCRDIFIVCYEDFDRGGPDALSLRILNGIRAEIAAGPAAEVVFAGHDMASSIAYYRTNPAMRVRGVIMLHCQDRNQLAALSEAFPDLRFVQANYLLERLEELPGNVCGVFNDDFGGAYQGTEYLLSRGCRQPAFLELEIADRVYRERCDGFLQALNDHGLRGRSMLVKNRLAIPPDERLQFYRECAVRLLAQLADCDGFFTCNDPMAAALHNLLEERKLALPVLGYDDYSEFGRPRLDTVAVDYERIGGGAVRQLLQKSLPRFHKILPRLKVGRVGRSDEFPDMEIRELKHS